MKTIGDLAEPELLRISNIRLNGGWYQSVWTPPGEAAGDQP
jgi:hypothetical protein